MTTYYIYNANGKYLGSIKAVNPNSPTFNRIIKAAYGSNVKVVKAAE